MITCARHGVPIPRLCLVLDHPKDGAIYLTYFTTFKQGEHWTIGVEDANLWYPVSPAPQNLDMVPLPLRPEDAFAQAQWISLRRQHSLQPPPDKQVRLFYSDGDQLMLTFASTTDLCSFFRELLPGRGR